MTEQHVLRLQPFDNPIDDAVLRTSRLFQENISGAQQHDELASELFGLAIQIARDDNRVREGVHLDDTTIDAMDSIMGRETIYERLAVEVQEWLHESPQLNLLRWFQLGHAQHDLEVLTELATLSPSELRNHYAALPGQELVLFDYPRTGDRMRRATTSDAPMDEARELFREAQQRTNFDSEDLDHLANRLYDLSVDIASTNGIAGAFTTSQQADDEVVASLVGRYIIFGSLNRQTHTWLEQPEQEDLRRWFDLGTAWMLPSGEHWAGQDESKLAELAVKSPSELHEAFATTLDPELERQGFEHFT